MGLTTQGLTKSFGGMPVFEGLDLEFAGGEIHALLGANGAGKSTVIKCISGGVKPDAGTIKVDSRTFTSFTPAEARQAGVAVIHQTPSLALTLTAAENIYLGEEITRTGFLDRAAMQHGARDILDSLGSTIDPGSDLQTLSNADLQVIEIAKALNRRPRVLILDEATAALTEREVERLAGQLRSLKRSGLPIIFVTHRLTEVLDLADRVTVLRGGAVALREAVEDVTRDDLVTAIVGDRREEARSSGHVADDPRSGRVLLTARGLSAPRFGPVDFDLHNGEILGVFGLVGAGRTELLETIAGATRPTSGTMDLGGERYAPGSPYDAAGSGVSLVPSDRLRKSVFPDLTAEANLLLPNLGRTAFAALFRRRARERGVFDEVAASMSLSPANPTTHGRQFSGGNQQKLVIGRWLNSVHRCRVLLLDEPTDGIDVGARDDLYNSFTRFAAQPGQSVLFTSSEPEELLRIADRVIVLSRGRVAGILHRDQISERQLLELAHAGETRQLEEVPA